MAIINTNGFINQMYKLKYNQNGFICLATQSGTIIPMQTDLQIIIPFHDHKQSLYCLCTMFIDEDNIRTQGRNGLTFIVLHETKEELHGLYEITKSQPSEGLATFTIKVEIESLTIH